MLYTPYGSVPFVLVLGGVRGCLGVIWKLFGECLRLFGVLLGM